MQNDAKIYLDKDSCKDEMFHQELQKGKLQAEELASIIEGSFDGVMVTDGDGTIIMINKSYERITGLSRKKMLGQNLNDLLKEDYIQGSVAFHVMEEKRIISLRHNSNDRNFIATGTPIFNDKKEITKIIINARDISEIYELQQELLKAQEMEKLYFEQLSKAEEKEEGPSLIIANEQMQKIYFLAGKLGNFNTTVMILGESGVGKEEVAKYIHSKDEKRKGKFVTVNCGAIPENLLESELFGYVKGAFTGASTEGKIGVLEAAEGGTLFLDEIGEMPLSLQVKILRVIETHEVTRIGSTKPTPVDVRILAATNKDLEEEVKNKNFRKDLYYRLNVVQIQIPPLRERIDDIAPLAMHFLKIYNSRYGQEKKLTYDVLQEMQKYSWPGNIRELKNTVERMVIVCHNDYLQILDLPWFFDDASANYYLAEDDIPLNEAMQIFEKKLLEEALRKHKSTRKMAAALKVDQATIVRKLKKYSLVGSKNKDTST